MTTPSPQDLARDDLLAELVRRVERLEGLLRGLGSALGGGESPKIARCSFCQCEVGLTHSAILEHVKSCPRHPMRAVEAQLGAAERELGALKLQRDAFEAEHDAREANHRARLEAGPPPPDGIDPAEVTTIEVEAGNPVRVPLDAKRFLQLRVKVEPSQNTTAGGPIGPAEVVEEHAPGCKWLRRGPTDGDEPATCDCGLEENRSAARPPMPLEAAVLDHQAAPTTCDDCGMSDHLAGADACKVGRPF